MSSAKKRSKIIALCVCFVLLGSFLIFLITCVSFRQTIIPGGAGECISIAFFEKQKMRTVDKVVLRDVIEHKAVTVTDMDLIREITKEVTVASRTDIKVTPMGYIDLYSNDELVRSMLWNIHGKDIVVYEADRTHWLLFSVTGVGITELSDELADKLDALLEEALTQKPD